MSDFIEAADSPNKLRRLNPQSCSPASPQVRRDRGEDFQLPKYVCFACFDRAFMCEQKTRYTYVYNWTAYSVLKTFHEDSRRIKELL